MTRQVARTVLAIDPGESLCGLTVLHLVPGCTERSPAAYIDQSNKGQVRIAVAETLDPLTLYRKLESYVANAYACVLERYALYPWLLKEQGFSEVETAQCVGVVKYICRKADCPVYLQDAKGNLKEGRAIAAKAGFKMRERALGSGRYRYRGPDFDLPGKPHRRDSTAHGVRWAARDPSSPLLLARGGALMAQIVSKTGLSSGWQLFHWTMIVFTGGVWLPVYLVHRYEARRRVVTRLPSR